MFLGLCCPSRPVIILYHDGGAKPPDVEKYPMEELPFLEADFQPWDLPCDRARPPRMPRYGFFLLSSM